MPDRTRPIRKEICLNEQELNLIQHKMHQLGTHNFSAYAQKMLIDGYIIKVDYTEQKKLAAAVSRVASNINQICRRINSTGRCYAAATFQAATACCWTAFVRSTSLEACFAGGFAALCCPSSPSWNNPFAAPRSSAAARSAARQYDFPRSREIEFYLST